LDHEEIAHVFLFWTQGSPHWDMNFCAADEAETAEKAVNAHTVSIPDHDPVFGEGGPLVEIWRSEM
jgi:uncharacterized protein YjlB